MGKNLSILLALVLLAVLVMLRSFGWPDVGSVAGQSPPHNAPLAGVSQDAIAGWIANQENLVPPLVTPTFTGPPPEGYSSWEEAAAAMFPKQFDPNAGERSDFGAEQSAVGGIAELPDVRGGTPLQAESTGRDTALIAGIAGIAIVLPALGGMAWYVRRRSK